MLSGLSTGSRAVRLIGDEKKLLDISLTSFKNHGILGGTNHWEEGIHETQEDALDHSGLSRCGHRRLCIQDPL
jgi:hypothetical protein